MSRRERRYKNRQAKREARRIERSRDVGGIEDVFTYDALYKAGKKCCNGVRWKSSTQRFELHLFSNTAINAKRIRDGTWKPAKYTHFTITERGKTREIDAPRIIDRQIHKVYTQKVLLPLYTPSMIYNNGASLEGKGYDFSKRMLREDLRRHFRKYGRKGNIILMDFSKFFPSVSHEEVLKRHKKFIRDEKLRKIGDDIVLSVCGDKGLSIGVEPNQTEMIAFPSDLDNYIKCQLSIKGAGHYMDDYYIIVPPERNTKKVLRLVIRKARSLDLIVNESKTRIVPLDKPFRYCKAKYALSQSDRVFVNGSRDSAKRARRKFRAFRYMVTNGELGYGDLWTSVSGSLAYFEDYNDHEKVLTLRRYFYHLFGFSAENIDNFRQRETNCELYCA